MISVPFLNQGALQGLGGFRALGCRAAEFRIAQGLRVYR